MDNHPVQIYNFFLICKNCLQILYDYQEYSYRYKTTLPRTDHCFKSRSGLGVGNASGPFLSCFGRNENCRKISKTNPHRSASTGGGGGVTGNRTRDTRIFSPLLYQLSYDTDLLCRCSNGNAKVGIFSDFANFHNTFFKKNCLFLLCFPLSGLLMQ